MPIVRNVKVIHILIKEYPFLDALPRVKCSDVLFLPQSLEVRLKKKLNMIF